jgi:hypothetical protein
MRIILYSCHLVIKHIIKAILHESIKNISIDVVGKNTLRTSKLGSDLHADFDRKEITF